MRVRLARNARPITLPFTNIADRGFPEEGTDLPGTFPQVLRLEEGYIASVKGNTDLSTGKGSAGTRATRAKLLKFSRLGESTKTT